jgi:4-hydroxymandelate synthase
LSSPIWCDHVQFYAEDVNAVSEELKDAYGFVELQPSRGNTNSNTSAHSVVLAQGSIVVAVIEASGQGPARDFVNSHGDGLARIGLRCTDLRAVYARAVAHGARVIEPPRQIGDAWSATLSGVGDLVHTVVEQPAAGPELLLPGIGLIPRAEPSSPIGLRSIDHFAICVPPGELAATAAFYEQAWSFERIFTEKISAGAQAMDSVVVSSPGRGVVLTLIEPAGEEPGQINHFLARHGGPGVQHMAFSAHDIVAAVSGLTERGVRFGQTPSTYYTHLTERVGTLRHDLLRLRDLGVLVDRDHDGKLYQIFTRSTHARGTYFTEIIERDGATTFGANNVKALFEAKQRELDQLLPHHSGR